jgi:DNA-binding Lrp family transcriptional regulator
VHDLCINFEIECHTVHLDEFDRKLLALLQEDARLTNNELAERMNLSPRNARAGARGWNAGRLISRLSRRSTGRRLGFGIVN